MDHKELQLVSLVLALTSAIANLYTAVFLIAEGRSDDPRVKVCLEVALRTIDECNIKSQNLINEIMKNGRD
jgi:hypothetical protein